MSHEQIIRAWKDSAYRNSLSAEELAQLPANPAGESLTEAELSSVFGGHRSDFTPSFISVQSCYIQKYSQKVNQTINQLTSVGVVTIAIVGNANSNNDCNNSASNSNTGTF